MVNIVIKWLQNPEITQMLQWLIFMNVADVVTGLIKAYNTESISSSIMRRGALTKIMIWFVVCVAGIISEYLHTDLTVYVITYYLFMEGVSIIENASLFISIPEKLKQALNNNEDKKDDNKQVSEPSNEIMWFIETNQKDEIKQDDEAMKYIK